MWIVMQLMMKFLVLSVRIFVVLVVVGLRLVCIILVTWIRAWRTASVCCCLLGLRHRPCESTVSLLVLCIAGLGMTLILRLRLCIAVWTISSRR